MPTALPVPTKNPGDVWTSSTWNSYVRDNINKLLNQAHRVLTVAQFTALAGIEDGDEVYLEVDATNGIIWHLRYVNAEPTYKWRFLGGPPMFSEVTTNEATSSTTYAALTTAGPSIALPRGGDFNVRIQAALASGNQQVAMSYDIGATGAVDADQVLALSTSTTLFISVARERLKAAIAAATTLTSKYKTVTAGTGNFQQRGMSVLPVRLI